MKLFTLALCLLALFTNVFGIRSMDDFKNGRNGGGVAGRTAGGAFNKVSTIGFPNQRRPYQPSAAHGAHDRRAALASRRRNIQHPFGARRNRILAGGGSGNNSKDMISTKSRDN